MNLSVSLRTKVVMAVAGPGRLQRMDAVSGAIISNVVAMAIIVATAAAIGGSGVLKSAAHAAHTLGPVAGPAAEVLFGIGLLRVSPGPTFPGAVHRADPDWRGGGPGARKPDHAHHQHPGSRRCHHPVTLILILILANRRSLLGTAANGRWARWVGGIAIGSVAAVASVYVVETILGWFGIG